MIWFFFSMIRRGRGGRGRRGAGGFLGGMLLGSGLSGGPRGGFFRLGGGGGVGPITESRQKEYLGIATGERPDPYGWLEPINQPASEPVL